MARRQKRAYSGAVRLTTRAAARLVALLTCLCFLPSGSAVAQTERLLGAEGETARSGISWSSTRPPVPLRTRWARSALGHRSRGRPCRRRHLRVDGRRGGPQGALITIDRDTGAGTLVGTLAGGDPAADLTFLDGTLFGWLERTAKDLATIDKATGVATVVCSRACRRPPPRGRIRGCSSGRSRPRGRRSS